jgi:hypothetical protein
MACTLREDQYTLLITPRSIILRLRNFSDQFVEKIKTHIGHEINFFSEKRVVHEIM